ncbi:MAG: guanylate kinase [bacterium]
MLSRRHQPFLIVVSAPSGAGKTTICRAVVRRDHNIFYSVSVTTRPPRRNEHQGKSYLFLTEREFRRLLNRGRLLEYARVYGSYYGTPKAPVLKAFRSGKDVLADLDIQGMRTLRRVLPGTVGIFLMPPSIKELERRLGQRQSECAEELTLRRRNLEKELASISEFDYLVINDKIDRAVRDVMTIIQAERLRTSRRINIKGGLNEECVGGTVMAGVSQ